MAINKERELAQLFIEDTKRHVFLTGRAGSGKTTLLKEIIQNNKKNTVVVAPTGVAAINAGGVTIHSMFQMPISGFIPSNDYVDPAYFTNHSGLMRHMRMSKEKRAVIRAIDLLIIDEISMVRPDLLDALDYLLRKVRKSSLPFGDLQVLMVGDLYQLPPVIKEYEWQVLQQYYQGPYFFHAKVWQTARLIPIELKKIYRQKDLKFVEILNNVREGKAEAADIEHLNSRCIPDYDNEEEAIILTTHNASAEKINQKKLAALPGKKFTLKANIDGKFSESAYPCSAQLALKKDTQIMFIKNDKDRRYYNGKLATVLKYDREEDIVKVRFKEEQTVHWISREKWSNDTFKVDQDSQEVMREELGSFSQFPFRLAWAVTVHKSQGLTLDQVLLDLGSSFAAGQAYVALSRCTSLDGIVLTSKLQAGNIIIDKKIRDFYARFPEASTVEAQLPAAKKEYSLYQLKRAFQFFALQGEFEAWEEYVKGKTLPDRNKLLLLRKNIKEQMTILGTTAKDFQGHLNLWIFESNNDPERIQHIIERCEKAIPYFTTLLHDKIILPLHQHLEEYQTKSKVKKYLQLSMNFYTLCWRKMEQLYSLKVFEEKLFSGKPFKKDNLSDLSSATKQVTKKGATYEITLELFELGFTIKQIAKRREMAVSTIESHMTKHLESGAVLLDQLMEHARIKKLEKLLAHKSFDDLVNLKMNLPEQVSFSELRWMRIYLKGQ